jgi:hypothetical protein
MNEIIRFVYHASMHLLCLKPKISTSISCSIKKLYFSHIWLIDNHPFCCLLAAAIYALIGPFIFQKIIYSSNKDRSSLVATIIYICYDI